MPRLRLKIGVFSTLLLFLLLSFNLYKGNLGNTLLALAALAFHELTHSLCCELLGYKIQELRLTILGGCLTINPSFVIDPQAELLIAASGPAANLLMVLGVLYLQLLQVNNNYLEYWLQINFLIGWINLIPASPLDGGRIVHAWLTKHLGLKNSNRITKFITVIIGFLLLILGIVRLLTQRAWILYLLIGLFIIVQLVLVKNPSLELFWKARQHKQKRLAKKGFLAVKPIFVEPATLLRLPLQDYGSNDYLLFFRQDKDQKLCIITEEFAWNTFINQGYNATFGSVKNEKNEKSNKTCTIQSDEVE